MKYIIFLTLVLIIQTSMAQSADLNAQTKTKKKMNLVWDGSTESRIYKSFVGMPEVVQVRLGRAASDGEILVKEQGSTLEVQNKSNAGAWGTVQVYKDVSTTTAIEASTVLSSIGEVFNCGMVQIIIDIKNSTAKTELFLDSVSIGEIKENGRFYYATKGICKNKTVELEGTLKNCKDFSDSFKASKNPEEYKKPIVLSCSK